MKKSLIKRLLELEKTCGIQQKHRSAKVVYDPDVFDSLDLSHIEAKALIILPNNGHKLIGDQKIPTGSYIVTYS